MKVKRQLALLVIGALLLGLLPAGNATVSEGAATPASTSGGTARADYGLNNPTTDSDGVTTWDCVWFGNYWQEDTNGDGKADKNDAKQPIKWRVLSVDGDDAFLLADKNLDAQRYNETITNITWEVCTMRSWLNGYGAASNEEGKDYGDNNFINDAFSISEQSAIRTTNVVNNDNPFYNTESGNDTLDKVYLLSLEEMTNPVYGFSSDDIKQDESRRAKNTEYAKTQGVDTNTSEEYAGNGCWWLRSPGYYNSSATLVYYDGDVHCYGFPVNHDSEAVRPALHLNLKASSDAISTSSWSYAGKVTSEGVEIGAATPVPGVSAQPTESASAAPTEKPGVTPTVQPTGLASAAPTEKPGVTPAIQPTGPASATPTEKPCVTPAVQPTLRPTTSPGTGNSPLPTPPSVYHSLNNPTTDSDGVTTWDCVWFGNYWQEDTNGDGKADKNDAKQPIKWRVLSVDGDDAFLLADKNLDAQKYNETMSDVTWETCTMRSWLNGYGAASNEEGKDYGDNNFLNNAFTINEQSVIRTTNVVNNDNPGKGSEGGNDTSDQVYLLSLDELVNPSYGFTSKTGITKTRQAVYTSYEAARVREINTSTMRSAGKTGGYLLRSIGASSDLVPFVDSFGTIYARITVDYGMAVRPALHLNLSSISSWSYAGKVIAERDEIETATPMPGVSPQPTATASASPTEKPSVTPAVQPTLRPTTSPGAGNSPLPTPPSVYHSLNNPTTDSRGVTTWDCVWFGNYWQEDTNGDGKADKNDAKQPIKWRVLSVDGNDAFLLADKNLDVQRYNDTYTDTTWETCTLRSWLNGYGAATNQEGKDYRNGNFLDYAFTSEEQLAVRFTSVVNNNNPVYGTEGGNNTIDKVYLLSIDEAKKFSYGFSSNTASTKTRQAVNTSYAADGGEINSSGMSSNGKTNVWWFRSPGNYRFHTSGVDSDGMVVRYGIIADSGNVAVRPVLHLNLLFASSWSYAGKVTSEGVEIGPATPEPSVSPQPTATASTSPTSKPTTSPGTENSPLPTSPSASYGLNNPTTDSDGVTTWDCVWFGNYWQEDTNGDGKADTNDVKKPIMWRVLSVNGDDAFLLANNNLDVQKYNETQSNVTWETCTMRSWLNGYGAASNKDGKDYVSNNFLDNAFSSAEQSAIRTTSVVNNDNPSYGTEGGNGTSDQVYLLSLDEMMNPSYGFPSDRTINAISRRAKDTKYAKARGAWTSATAEYADNSFWWLRSPGGTNDYTSFVDDDGCVDWDGYIVCRNDVTVRPALHLNLSSTSSWSYAGIVVSYPKKEEEIETATPVPGAQTSVEPEKPAQVIPGSTTQTVTPVLQPQTSPTASRVGKVESVKLKQKKQTVTVSWKKVPGAAGYQIWYSTSKKWKGKKQKLLRKNKVTVKNLKRKKTYYFRVRAYRLEGTKKVYGGWSKTKRITMNKATGDILIL